MSDPHVRKFAELVARHEARLEKLERAQNQSQLKNSSLEDGSINTYDTGGNLRQRWGKQSDGTFAVTYRNGDQPPRPSAPVVSARQLYYVVSWDGLDENGKAPPADVVRADVHDSQDSEYTVTGSTVVGSLMGEGALAVPADLVTHYIKLVLVTNADVRSEATAAVEVLPLPTDKLGTVVLEAGRIFTPTDDPNEWHLEIGNPTKPLHWRKGGDSGFYVEHDPLTGASGTYVSGSVQFGDSVLEDDYIDLDETDATGYVTPTVRQHASEPGTGPGETVSEPWPNPTTRGNLLLATVFARDFHVGDRTNRCPNPKLDNNADGWYSFGAQAGAGGRNFNEGWRWRLFPEASTARSDAGYAAVPVAPGPVSFSVEVFSAISSWRYRRLMVNFSDANGSYVGEARSEPILMDVNQVQRVGFTASAPAGAETAAVFLTNWAANPDNTSSGNSSEDYYSLTRLLIERVDGVLPYFDGDSEGASWSGTPGNSTSLLPATDLPQPPSITPPTGWSEAETVTYEGMRLSLFAIPNADSRTGTERFDVSPAAWRAVSLAEFSGIDAASPLDQTSTASGTSDTPSTGTTAATTQANELWFAAHAWSLNGASAYTPGASEPFQQLDGVPSWVVDSSEYRGWLETAVHNTTSTGTVECTRDLDGRSADWLGIAATFKARAYIGDPPSPGAGKARLYAKPDSSGVTQLRAIDSSGTVTTVGGRLPHARYYQTSAQDITNEAETFVRYQEAHESDPAISSNDDGTIFTIATPGVWTIHASCRLQGGSGAGERYIAVVNTDDYIDYRYADNASSYGSQAVSTSRRFNAGDRVSVVFYQTTGGTAPTDPLFGENISLAFSYHSP